MKHIEKLKALKETYLTKYDQVRNDTDSETYSEKLDALENIIEGIDLSIGELMKTI